MASTPACAALDRAGVAYGVHPYEHDAAAESFGLEAAELLGIDPELVFKTLVAETADGELVVAVVPVTGSLNLKKLARAAGTKRASMADPARAERGTGYVVGGISPLGQRTPHRTFIDESAVLHDHIYVSGGRRGFDLSIDPTDLIAVLDAESCDLRG